MNTLELEALQKEASWLVETAGLMELPNTAVVEVLGDDNRSWVQGQVTNDISRLKKGESVYALVVSLKGKIVTDVWVLDEGQTLYLLLPQSVLDEVLTTFDKHIIMEDVTLQRRPDLSVLTLQGPEATHVVDAIPGARERSFPNNRLGTGGRDIVLDNEQMPRMSELLANRAQKAGGGKVSESGWELARLRLARPEFGKDFGPEDLPQEAGLKHRAVSFNKGCYVGQEVVCMVENRGKPPRRLVLFAIEGKLDLVSGTPIETKEGESVGEIRSSLFDAKSPGKTLALGYVKRSFLESAQEMVLMGQSVRAQNVVGEAAP